MTKLITLVVLVLIVLAGLGGCSYVNLSNEEVRLRNKIEAKVENRNAVFDNGKKIVAQKAQVTSRYAADLDSLYTNAITARYEGGMGSLMAWIKEENPTLDPSIYQDLSTAIEVTRKEFAAEQTALLALDEQHKNLRGEFPGNVLLADRDDVEFKIITSSATQKQAEEGIEDNVQVF